MTAQSSSTQARHGMTTDNEVLLEVKGLCVDYVTESGNIRACDNANFLLRRGEILGVAGESACGKSTLLNALGRLQRMPAATSAGQILFHDRNGSVTDLATLSEADLKPYRWTKIAVVMQSAMACLNPILKLSEQFIDVQRAHDPSLAEKDALTKSAELLEAVGISADRLSSFPFQLSGGMQHACPHRAVLGVRAGSGSHGRAHHGRRRRHAATDPSGGASGPEETRILDRLRHPRPVPPHGDLGQDSDHVRRTDRRGWHPGTIPLQCPSPVHPRSASGLPAAERATASTRRHQGFSP